MTDRDPIIGTPYGTKVHVEAERHAQAKEEARQREEEAAQRASMIAKRLARTADLAVEGATEKLMMRDDVDEEAVAIVAAKQALQGDLVDLAPAQGSKAGTYDRVE